MKKKILTLVLAMTLVMSSVMVALAATAGSDPADGSPVATEPTGESTSNDSAHATEPTGESTQASTPAATDATQASPTDAPTQAPSQDATQASPTDATQAPTQAPSQDATQASPTDAQPVTQAPVKAAQTALTESINAAAGLDDYKADVKVSGMEKLTWSGISMEAAEEVVNLAADKKLVTYVAVDLKPSADYKQGDKVEITLPLKAFEELKDAKYIDVFRVQDGKLVTVATGVEVKDGKFTFTTDHFSTYVFSAGVAPSTSDEGTKTGDMSPIVPITIALVGSLAIFGAALVFKKKEEI